MDTNDNIKKLETFFEDDLKVKELLNDIIPNEMDFYDDDSKFKYVDKLLSGLYKIELYINRMALNYNFPRDILMQFDTKIKKLQNDINSSSFYQLLDKGYNEVRNFIHANASDMRKEFIDSIHSIRGGFLGYSLFYGNNVLNPITINEFLHYIHSYIINNERFYFSIPIVRSTKEENKWQGISLRGISNDIGNRLYESILSSNINSDCIDIINLGKRMLIMARDLGHATVIEIEIDKENIFVKYYIPKNNNSEMVSELKGIRVNKEEFANGSFQTTEENFVKDLCTLMKGIPTDRDRVKTGFDI